MSKYDDYKRQAFIINTLQEFLCDESFKVQTFRLEDIELTLDKESGKFSIYTPKTGRIEFGNNETGATK